MIFQAARAAAVVLMMGMLAACASPIVEKTGPISIQSIQVTAQPTVKSETDIRSTVERDANNNVLREMHNGKPVTAHIDIQRVTYKNAAMSLLVGSANMLSTKVTIIDQSGQTLAQFDESAIADAMINGVIGAAIAATQDQGRVDQELSAQYAKQLQRSIFGKAPIRPTKIALPGPAEVVPAAPPSPPAAPARPAPQPTS